MRVLAIFLFAAAAVTAVSGTARAQPTTQQQVTDIVFSEIEKRILKEILGDGRYEANGDGTYRKTERGGKYDDLEQGRDGKFYGKKRDKGEQGRGKGLPPAWPRRQASSGAAETVGTKRPLAAGAGRQSAALRSGGQPAAACQRHGARNRRYLRRVAGKRHGPDSRRSEGRVDPPLTCSV